MIQGGNWNQGPAQGSDFGLIQSLGLGLDISKVLPMIIPLTPTAISSYLQLQIRQEQDFGIFLGCADVCLVDLNGGLPLVASFGLLHAP